jgi:hypothetical protein
MPEERLTTPYRTMPPAEWGLPYNERIRELDPDVTNPLLMDEPCRGSYEVAINQWSTLNSISRDIRQREGRIFLFDQSARNRPWREIINIGNGTWAWKYRHVGHRPCSVETCNSQAAHGCNVCGGQVCDTHRIAVRIRSSGGSVQMCAECAATNRECHTCGRFRRMPEGENECRDCLRQTLKARIQAKEVAGHDFKPRKWPIVKAPKERNPLLMGMEIEIEHCDHEERGPRQNVRLYDITTPILGENHVWKRDGSLDESGAELVLAPHSRGALLPVLPPLGRALSDEGYEDTDRCGIHVHLSREHLEQHLRPLRMFFVGAKDELVRFSRRSQESLGNYSRFPESFGSVAHGGGGKYSAIHELPNTIEIRLFRSTLDPVKLCAIPQLLQSLYEYIKSHKPGEFGAYDLGARTVTVPNKWYDFVAWVMKRGGCEEFIAACDARKLLPGQKPKKAITLSERVIAESQAQRASFRNFLEASTTPIWDSLPTSSDRIEENL